jgi:5-methylcytosine-specific restriction endonuclease McrA
MRPVERGSAPQIYAQYGDAIEDLKSRLGSYCSYCERQVAASLAVEHVIPKSLRPELETEWNNFLLGCTNCNSVKGDRAVEIQNFIWPDRDNTLLALVYSCLFKRWVC